MGVVLLYSKGASAMARWTNQYKKAVETTVGRRVSKQEQLLFDATELVSRALEHEGISRAQLARRIGKSKAYVTQVLRGQNNMTLRTLSDLTDVLGYAVELGAVHTKTSHRINVGHWIRPGKCSLTEAVRALAAPLSAPRTENRPVFEQVAA
jgi:transcriptional regulator with XRE-family HTH domain